MTLIKESVLTRRGVGRDGVAPFVLTFVILAFETLAPFGTLTAVANVRRFESRVGRLPPSFVLTFVVLAVGALAPFDVGRRSLTLAALRKTLGG